MICNKYSKSLQKTIVDQGKYETPFPNIRPIMPAVAHREKLSGREPDREANFP